jgi:hypothetical protein
MPSLDITNRSAVPYMVDETWDGADTTLGTGVGAGQFSTYHERSSLDRYVVPLIEAQLARLAGVAVGAGDGVGGTGL